MTLPTYQIKIYLSGPIEVAKQVIREHILEKPLCVTIDPTTFIYFGGEEAGYVVGLLNYPRFPVSPNELNVRADILAELLIKKTFQRSALVVKPEKTSWITLGSITEVQSYWNDAEVKPELTNEPEPKQMDARRLAASREEKRELMRELVEAREQWRMSSVCRDIASQRNRLLAALQGVMHYRLGKPPYDFHQYGEAERDNMAHDAWQVIEQNCMSLLAEIQGQPHDPECNKCNQLIDALERIRDYRGLVGENDPQSVAHDALADVSTSDTPDINAIGDHSIGQLKPNADN